MDFSGRRRAHGMLSNWRSSRIIDHPSGNGELTIELLGRSDDQINLRGYRIEPREIESCLVSHPGVEAAAVIAIGDRGLAALCVGKANVAGQLASWVAAKLPERMRPSKFRFAERLPLTSRGKLDRTAIAELLMRSSGAEGGDAAMSDASLFRSPLWSDLAAVLEETLELESVHPAERFVEIGGHSLLAIIITAKLSDRFGVDLQLRDFVAVDRLGELADVIENLRVSQRVDDKGDLKKLPKNERLMIDSAPLTPQQQRLWILEQLGQGDSYVIPAIAEVEGELDAERLTQALDWIRQRHEALQLSIETTAEGPIQRFDSTAKVPFESRKFSDHSTAREWIDQCAKKPFNLNVSPLWKVSLAKVSKRQSILLINFHHLIIDGWSMQRFIHELQELYHVDGATLPNRCVPGGDMLGRYAAYCQCQSERSRGQVDLTDNGSRQRCVAMYGDLQDVNLWPDRRRPARLSSSGASTATVVNAELNQRITKLCRAIGITKASFWLATLRFYLDRRQGGNDFAIGMPTSGRDERAVVDLIGFFVGTLVLRLDNPGDNESITVVDWLRHANQQLSDAMLNPSFSVDEILTFTQPERRLDRSPLFQVLFSYAAESVKPFELGKAILRPVLPKVDQAKFEWTVSVSEMLDGSASLSLEYCTDLFFQSTAQAVVRQLVETADVLVHQQQSLLRTLSIRESSSKHDEEIIRPVRAFSSAFGEHVSGSPESIAIEDGQAKLTYRQLEQRSRSLRSVGAGDVPVQIATDRSVESLIELIRCLRANAPFVLTDRMITKNLAHHSSTLDDAACVALTSGTQGIPKGVVIRRDSLDRHNEAFVRLLNLSTTDRVTQYGSAEFDLYLEEVLPTLRAGATLCLVPEDCRLDPMAFTKWVIENAITVVDLPTAFFHRWAESIVSLPHFPNLRAVVVGGERLDRDLATGFVAAFPLIDLWNSYGPTEATIICTAHKVSAMEDHAEVPIGIPFAGAKLLVVDSAGTRVPSGCPGELVIAGIGLANGYLKAEELGRGNGFRRHPEDPSRIAYWTGDRVRVDQSGVFHFLGRLDDQIKVRGVRVYLNDVAERIRKHAAVAAVAVVCEMDAASPTLVAAVVLKDALNPNVAIRRELATALPASMRPSQWCFCEAIPMTNRGKVDRRAIMNLALSSTSETLGSEATAEWDGEPQTQLAAIWEALLGHRDFTADDDFFLVGGHSLMAAMLVREIELAFDAKVALSRIFETPTIHALAKLIGPADQVTSKTEQAPRSNMLHRPCKDPFANTVSVLLPGLPGVSQVYEPLVTKLSERSEAFAFSIPGIDGRESIPESIDKLSDRWAFELTSVLRSNETPLQIFAHSFAASVLYRMLCNHRPWCERIERCVLIDAMPHRPIDWTAESRWMAGTPMTPEITGLNHQTRAALAMLLRSSSIESGEPLPMDIEFVIASQSRAWIDDRAWDSFFRSVRQVDCEGDHASLVQLQHCDAWL
ncbi:hypothetical protein C2E31_11910 [Rhodopirellula baltica]|nr:hypothetical protein C2E31_11910 [Rhodopirellula baltica]